MQTFALSLIAYRAEQADWESDHPSLDIFIEHSIQFVEAVDIEAAQAAGLLAAMMAYPECTGHGAKAALCPTNSP